MLLLFAVLEADGLRSLILQPALPDCLHSFSSAVSLGASALLLPGHSPLTRPLLSLLRPLWWLRIIKLLPRCSDFKLLGGAALCASHAPSPFPHQFLLPSQEEQTEKDPLRPSLLALT